METNNMEIEASGKKDNGINLHLQQIVSLALAEDLGERGDITSQAIFAAGDLGSARIITREPCVVSGLEACREVCRQIDSQLGWLPLIEDGQHIPADAEVAKTEGPVISILAAERTLLNFLSRLSGVATLTHAYVEALQGLKTRIAATRKTMPGLRVLEKQAVEHGGGETHRFGLYDAILIKDNHIAAAGSVASAVAQARKALGDDVDIEVEIDSIVQLDEAIKAGATRVLLDNMTPEQASACVRVAGGRVTTEASGGINLGNVRKYGEAGADVISVGMLTRSAPGIDFSLEMESKR